MYLSVCMEPWPIGLSTHRHSETSTRSFKLERGEKVANLKTLTSYPLLIMNRSTFL